jgi:proliferating cell nuclear antigen
LGIPDTEYPTSIRMSSSEFVRLCKELTQLAETVRIEVEDKAATFSFSGKAGAGKIKMKKNNAEKNEDQIDIRCEESVSSNYGLQYLNSFAKASSLSSLVTLHLSTQFPLMIEYEIENMGYVKFYLAPKMDDDETSK